MNNPTSGAQRASTQPDNPASRVLRAGHSHPILVRLMALAMLATTVVVASPTAPAEAAAPCSAGYVALTFDDGPDKTYTPKILDILKEHGVVATWFPNGRKVSIYPQLIKRAYDSGHAIANHTWNHVAMTSMSDSQIRRDLQRTYEEIQKAGAVPLRLYRPPFGATSDRVKKASAQAGWSEIKWSVDPRDWTPGRSGSYIRDHIIKHSRGGSVILLHDGVRNAKATAAALPGIIKGLKAKGLCFGVLDDTGQIVKSNTAMANCGPDKDERFCDIEGSMFKTSIEWAAETKLTVGCNPPDNTRFCPKSNVTRGEMAVFIARAYPLPKAGGDQFGDDNGAFYESAANQIAAAGITKGCNPPANDRYCGNRAITRGEVAVFIARAARLPSTDKDFFRDDDGKFYEDAANRLAAAGITAGCGGDNYCGDRRLSREEMVTLLQRNLAR